MQSANRRSTSAHQSSRDLEAVRRAQAGDESAFAYLYQQYKRRIYSLCWRMLDNTDLSEDLTQEVFLCAYRRLGSFRGDSAFYTWLYTIAVNAVLMYHRKNAKERNREFALEFDETDEREDLMASFGDSDGRLEGAVDRIALGRAIDELAPGVRMIFILHDVEGYEHQEIAELLGCHIGTCKSQLHKARKKLRKLLIGHPQEVALAA